MFPDPKNPAQFFPFFVAFWCAICFVLSLIGGWHSLAQHYRLNGAFAGKRWHLRSGSLRLVNYGNCLTLGADSTGLFMSILFPFRIGHPPLHIPWSEVSAESYRLFFFPRVKFHFKQEPTVSFKLSKGLASELASASSGQFSIGADT